MQRDDEFRLKHMLEAAEEAVSFIKGKSLDDFNNNRQLALAVLKDIEIIGEAANKVSKETQLQHKNIPWAAIIGMRHRLIHT
jgi:uncharacterized protein with HEPN domain